MRARFACPQVWLSVWEVGKIDIKRQRQYRGGMLIRSVGLVALTFLVASPSALAMGRAFERNPKVAILSDVDDTVRPTGTLHKERSIKVALGIIKVQDFSGMSELYDQLLLAGSADVDQDQYYVSGAPLVVKYWIKKFLRNNDFSDENVAVRVGGPLRDVEKYKRERIEKVLKRNPETKFYFFGDDTQKDPDAIAHAAATFPNQLAGLYIHRIEDANPAKPGQTPYFTAVDVALRELKKGKLNEDQVRAVAQAMLDDKNFKENVVPSYARLCPEAGWLTAINTEISLEPSAALQDQLDQIQARVAAEVCTPDRRPEDGDRDVNFSIENMSNSELEAEAAALALQ
jgi:hypothetical protein